MTKKWLNRRERSDAHSSHVCRLPWSIEILVKMERKQSCQLALWLYFAVESIVLAESSCFLPIFSRLSKLCGSLYTRVRQTSVFFSLISHNVMKFIFLHTTFPFASHSLPQLETSTTSLTVPIITGDAQLRDNFHFNTNIKGKPGKVTYQKIC